MKKRMREHWWRCCGNSEVLEHLISSERKSADCILEDESKSYNLFKFKSLGNLVQSPQITKTRHCMILNNLVNAIQEVMKCRTQ